MRLNIILAGLLAWGLAGCGGGGSSAPAQATPPTPVADTPAAFTVLNTMDAGELGGFNDLAVDGSRLYTAEGDDPLRVLDLARPAHPVELSRIDTFVPMPGGGTSDAIYKLAVGNGLLATAVVQGCWGSCTGWFGEIRLYDVSAPASPRRVGRIDAGVVTDMLLDGTSLYVLRGGVFDFIAADPVASGNFSNTFGRLDIYDVSNPAAPVLMGSAPVGGAGRMVKSGNRIFTAHGERGGMTRGWQVLDVSNPAQPTALQHAGDPSSDGEHVALSVAYPALYVITPGKDLRMFDLSAAAPEPVALDMGGEPVALAREGNRLYVARSTQGVAVFDISNPVAPRRLPDVFAGTAVKDIKMLGGYGLLVTPEVRDTLPSGAYTVRTRERLGLFTTR